MRLLTVDQCEKDLGSMALSLKFGGRIVDPVRTGEEALGMIRHYDYDLVVIGSNFPDMHGIEFIRRMRAAKISTPIMVFCRMAQSAEKARFLKSGADEFLSTPLESEELQARINAITRRSRGFSHSIITIGLLRINLDGRQVHVNDRAVHLTGKEYEMLELMAFRRGMVLTKEAFLNHMYGGMDEPEMKIIDVFICKLRKKLADAGAPSLIQTVWGRGYTIREDSDNYYTIRASSKKLRLAG